MIIATKELIGPVVAVCLWETSHQGQAAVVVNDNQNACCWINSRGGCRNMIAQYLIFVLRRAETRNDLAVYAAYVNTKRNLIADRGTRELIGLTSGAEAADRIEEYFEWAAQTGPATWKTSSSRRGTKTYPHSGRNRSSLLLLLGALRGGTQTQKSSRDLKRGADSSSTLAES